MVSQCVLVAMIAATACAGRPPRGAAPAAATPEAAHASAAPAADPFRAEVAPVLARRCAPCHNPGGRMYGTMPFDQASTVTAHSDGILKRIKDPAEHAAIRSWLAGDAPR